MAKDLVAKKKTTGSASKRRKRSHKGGVLMSSGKKVPSRADLGRKHARRDQQLNAIEQEDSNMGWDTIMWMKVGGHLIGLGDGCFMMMRNKSWRNQVKRKGS